MSSEPTACPPAAEGSSAAARRSNPGQETRADPALIAVTVQARDGASHIAASIGDTLLAALKKAGFPLLSVCGGRAVCGTCRTGIAPAWWARLPPPGKVERDLLACLPERRDDDRLACQIILTAGLDGLEVRAHG
jgi:ferredoxin